MSHFPVIVVTDKDGDWEQPLAPYCETDEGCDERPSWFDFDVEVDRKDFKSKATEIVEGIKTEDKDREEFKKWLKSEDYTKIFEKWFGGELYKGNWGYWRNHDAKWDWYAFGGRWCAYFKAKEGKTGVKGEPSWGHGDDWKYPEGKFDQMKFGDIDWEGMLEEEIKEVTERWEKGEAYLKEKFDDLRKLNDTLTEDARKEAREKILNEWKWKFHFEREDKLADLVDKIRGRNNRPFAFVGRDGVWHEEAEMGWWAMTSNERPNEFHKEWTELLKTVKPDDLFTLVDCHI